MVDEMDRYALDVWTPVHASVGFGLGAAGMPFVPALALNLMWEAFENSRWPKGTIPGFRPEIAFNAALDIVAAMFGWTAGYAIRTRRAKRRRRLHG